MMRRVVITGMGAVTPLATDLKTYWERLLAGKSGIGLIEQVDTREFKVKFGGEVKNWRPEKFFDSKACRRMDQFSQFAMVAALEAWTDAGLDIAKEDPFRLGSIVGCGIGGLNEYEDQHTKFMQGGGPRSVSPFVIPKMMPNAGAGNISIHFGLAGPSRAVSTACASAGDAIADAMRVIQLDDADLVVAGGAEAAITDMGLGGFISARALSSRNDNPQAASRPFDKDRDGFVVGEGAGILILEELEFAKARGANILAEIIGYGMSADAFHMTGMAPEGEGCFRSMKNALRVAGIEPDKIDYVNAHATSTPLGDALESKAIENVFGERALNHTLLVSSTKSMTGHLLGGAGGLEAAITIIAMQKQIAPPTMNLENVDPVCRLNYVANKSQAAKIDYALSNSFGFGGTNGSLVFKRWGVD
jgi:3-oxoacyl-[acyl-carrier-protein] synthase II